MLTTDPPATAADAAPPSRPTAPARHSPQRLLLRVLPRTMVGLIAASKVLAMAPLLVALVIMSVTLDRLLLSSEQLISDGQRVEAFGAQLRTELLALERVARQQNALQDPTLLELFHQRLRGARALAAEFGGERLPIPVETAAHGIAGHLDQIASESRAGISAEQIDRVSALVANTEAVVAEGRASINSQVLALRERSEKVRGLLVVSMVLVSLLTAALTLALSRVIARPLQSLRGAIAALGTANYELPVVIEYPRELARLGEKLEWLRRRLRDLEADKDRFLAHVSHELKTPLASLREGTDLLLDRAFGTLTLRQAEVAQILAESALDLDAQIRNLLAYAEWRRGQREVEMGWIDARALVDEVIASQRLTLDKRQLETGVQLDAPQIWGHRFSLRVSLGNLLSNAVKHSPRGSVIDVRFDRRYGRCMLSVRDRGRGIPVADRERILQPFVRGSDPEEAGTRGTGIGLSIVSETVRAHGGTLEVQDADPGARFVLEWLCPEGDPA